MELNHHLVLLMPRNVADPQPVRRAMIKYQAMAVILRGKNVVIPLLLQWAFIKTALALSNDIFIRLTTKDSRMAVIHRGRNVVNPLLVHVKWNHCMIRSVAMRTDR